MKPPTLHTYSPHPCDKPHVRVTGDLNVFTLLLGPWHPEDNPRPTGMSFHSEAPTPSARMFHVALFLANTFERYAAIGDWELDSDDPDAYVLSIDNEDGRGVQRLTVRAAGAVSP